MATKGADKLTAERLMTEVAQGIVDDDVEAYMPAHLIGPPTAGRAAGSGILMDGTAAPTVESTPGTVADHVDGAAGDGTGNQPTTRRTQKKARSGRYRHLATEPGMAATPFIGCYSAEHDPPYGGSHALVDDLSATHGQPPLLLPPTGELCVQGVVALAQLHAVWWQHPRLASGGDVAARLEWQQAAAQALGRRDPLEGVVPAFLDYLGDRLSAEQRGVCERLLATDARRRELRRTRPQTLRHGDAHWWNFLYPNTPALGAIRLLDWGSWCIGVGTDDLAYMIALHGYRAWRRRFEADLLRCYHDALVAAGVRGYDWQACREDYRWSIIDALAVAPHFWSIKVPAFIWWPKLECGLAAFEDHRCAELLDA